MILVLITITNKFNTSLCINVQSDDNYCSNDQCSCNGSIVATVPAEVMTILMSNHSESHGKQNSWS